MAVIAALILTTYLPLRGAQRAQGTSCAVMSGLLVPGAAILLHQGTGPLSGALTLAILSLDVREGDRHGPAVAVVADGIRQQVDDDVDEGRAVLRTQQHRNQVR